MIALIIGITGQDGLFLTRHLLSQGYKVIGTSTNEKSIQFKRFKFLYPEIETYIIDLSKQLNLINLFKTLNPVEIYNLGAVTSISQSFSDPLNTCVVNGIGFLNLVEAIKSTKKQKNVKIFQASSSEMFGKTTNKVQNENSAFHPTSPYGVAKLFAHNLAVNYRESQNIQICSGILFNHESEFRPESFVTRKISKAFAQIKLGQISRLKLGNIDTERDWGYAGDYVIAMHKMLIAETPDDYVIATGKSFSIRDFVLKTIEVAELKGSIEDYVDLDKNLARSFERSSIVGDSSKARKILNWSPVTTFENIVEKMFKNDFDLLSNNL